jgi:hypothetical protein
MDERLVLDVNDKQNVYVHSACLNYYLEKGILLKRVYRILEFKQQPIFKDFVDTLIGLTNEAKNSGDEIGSLMIKSIINSIFGKLLTSIDKFRDFKVSRYRAEALKYLASELLKDYVVLNENLVLFQMNRRSVYYGYKSLIGACVLSFAKLNWYRKHDANNAKFPMSPYVLRYRFPYLLYKGSSENISQYSIFTTSWF